MTSPNVTEKKLIELGGHEVEVVKLDKELPGQHGYAGMLCECGGYWISPEITSFQLGSVHVRLVCTDCTRRLRLDYSRDDISQVSVE